MKLLPEKQLFLNDPFQSTKKRRVGVWTRKLKILLEMCTVQHVGMKSVITFQPTKLPVSTTVESAIRLSRAECSF